MTKGKFIPCNTSRCFSFQQIIATTNLTESKKKKNLSLKTYLLTYLSKFLVKVAVIYLLKCLLCRRIKGVGKSDTLFHIGLSSHRKDIKNPNAIKACKHFNNWNHVFHKHGSYILIEQSNNIKNTSTEVLKRRLKERENY